jgi:ribonucleoside-diphosphate reductase alpha chain
VRYRDKELDDNKMKRKGSFAIYLEPWHADIFEFLDLRKNQGKDEIRARDLFLALWTNDIFMTRVDLDEDWSLMCPHECSGLTETWGKEFEELYLKYESEGRYKKRVKAREVWNKVLESQIETGTPYVLYKDSINEKSNQANIGLIRSSNLCAEIVQCTSITKAQEVILQDTELLKKLGLEEFIGEESVNETAVCNLASISLTKFVNKNKTYNFKKLYDVAYEATINLNNVIDVNYYPSAAAKFSNFCHRPIGLGVQGLSDVFFLIGIPHDSTEAKQLNKEIFETIYYAAMRASCDIAKVDGAYATFKGSPLSEGKFQFDLWGAEPTGRWDWEKLREDIKKWGVRNSLTTCVMPTASCQVSTTKIQTLEGVKSYRDIMSERGIDWEKLEKTKEQGWIKFDEPLFVKTRFGIKTSDKIFYNGHVETLDIEMEDGSIFTCSENHQFLVNRDSELVWVRADELNEDDDIVEFN